MPVFLFTDIEGSTKKWERYPEKMKEALKRHDEIIQKNIDNSGGEIIKHTGDGVFAVFEDGNPLKCTLDIQREFQNQDWEHTGEIRIRMGLHAGHAEKRGNDYFGPVINRTARVMGIAWGGQIILTPEVSTTSELPKNATLKDSGVHILKDLGEPQQIYQLIHPDLKMKEFPPLRSLSSHPNNLPSQPTPFLGREEELKELKGLLKDDSCRLLTIIGPGGIGKTRIAIQAGAEVIETFTDGVFFVPLAPLSSADFLISTIAESLNFSFYSREDEKIQLTNFLKEKNLLLIMDNFEHLTEGASIISDILNSTEKVNIMVTSRELLNLKGEWVYQIEGLEVPEGEKIDIEGYSAVQLFLDGAYRAKSSFNYTEKDRKSLIRVCQLVGGIPLGIEIASSWLRTLSLEEIKEEIEKNIDFLSSSKRDIPERHRSLRAVFDYSWNLLDEKERNVMSKLSIFKGGFSREAAEKVANANLPVLSSLLDKSLIKRNEKKRYEILEVLRKYVNEKLENKPEIKRKTIDRFCNYYVEFLHKREEYIPGPKREIFLKEIGEEIENIRQSWLYAVKFNNLEFIAKSLNSFYIYYNIHCWHKEGIELISTAIEGIDKEKHPEIFARLLSRRGRFLIRLGKLKQAEQLLQESLKTLEDSGNKKEIGETKNNLGIVKRLLGNYNEAMKLHREAREIFKELNDNYNLGISLNGMAYLFVNSGKYKKAERLHYKVLKIIRELKDKSGIASSLDDLAKIKQTQGKLNEARKLYKKSLKMSKEVDNQYGIGRSFNNLAIVESRQGNINKAGRYYKKSLEIFEKLGHQIGAISTLTNIGIIERMNNNLEEARKLHEKALKISEDCNYKVGIATAYNQLGIIYSDRGKLEKAMKYHKKSLEISEDINNLWMITVTMENIASVHYKTGNYNSSKKYYLNSLKNAIDIEAEPLALYSLVGISRILIKNNRKKRAYGILKFVKENPHSHKETKKEAQKIIKKLKNEMSKKEIEDSENEIAVEDLKELSQNLLSE